jgi:hypothetical protein
MRGLLTATGTAGNLTTDAHLAALSVEYGAQIWLMPFWPHWYIGGVFVIAFVSALIGLIAGIWTRFTMPGFFRGETLTRATPTLVPERP